MGSMTSHHRHARDGVVISGATTALTRHGNQTGKKQVKNSDRLHGLRILIRFVVKIGHRQLYHATIRKLWTICVWCSTNVKLPACPVRELAHLNSRYVLPNLPHGRAAREEVVKRVGVRV